MPINNTFETRHQQHGITTDHSRSNSKHRSSPLNYRRSVGISGNKTKWLIILTVMGCVVSLILMLVINRRTAIETSIPVIEAEPGPIKIRPVESHQAVPHSEKTIYSVLSPQEPVTTVENLLSQPEKPQSQNPSLPEDFMQSLEELAHDDEPNISLSGQTNTIGQPLAHAPQQSMVNLINSIENPSYIDDSGEDTETTTDNDDSLNINLNVPSIHQSIFLDEAASQPFDTNFKKQTVLPEKQSNQVEMSEIKIKSSKIVAPQVRSKHASAQKTIYRAQIGSALSKKGAEQLWQKLSKKTPQIFVSYKPFYEKIDLGAKIGIRYRVQIGQFSGESVQKFCHKLKSRGLDCVSVRQNAR